MKHGTFAKDTMRIPTPFHAVIVLALAASVFPAAAKPNIVYIMADDLGWADVGYNGAAFYETPNIDRLRAAGMEFTNAYPGGSNCMPSRSCIISGMYTPRTQLWTPGAKAKGNVNAMKLLVPRTKDKRGDSEFPSRKQLAPKVVSVAEVLNAAGYRTARFGKWHLGPDTQGFHVSDPDGKGADPVKSFYGNIDVAEDLTDAAVRFVGENKDGPFFIYLNHWDVHTPIRARKSVAEKYARKLKSKNWKRNWNPTYAAMIEAVDTSVGRIWQTLKAHGIDHDTLLIFTSDNGGHSGATFCEPLKGAKGAFYEGGIRVPACMTWPAVIRAGSTCDIPITGVDVMPTLAEIAGAALPNDQPVDGKSFLPLLRGETTLTNRAVFWHYPLYLSGADYNRVLPVHTTNIPYWRATPCGVIRKGNWKLIQFFENDSVELYNLKADPGETDDLAKTEISKARELLNELVSWQKSTRAVIPTTPNPDFNPDAVKTKRSDTRKQSKASRPTDS